MSSSRSSAGLDQPRRLPLTAIHASLTCGRPIDFDRPPSEKPSTPGCRASAPAALAAPGVELVVRKHLVGNDRHVAPGTEVSQPCVVLGGHIRSGRVVRGDDENRARPRRDGPFDRREVDAPPRVQFEIVGAGRHQFESREVLEQRIAGARHQHLVFGVGQQLEQQRVRFARARRQHDALGRHHEAAALVVRRDRTPRVHQPERRRRVRQATRIGQRREQIGGIREAGARRIRFGQVDERTSIGTGRSRLRVVRRFGARSAGVRWENTHRS